MGSIPTITTEIRQLLLLAVPLIVAQLAHTSMGFVDTLMVGRLGREALAGIALGNTVFFFLLIVCSGVVLAVSPVVSQAYGAGDSGLVRQAVRSGLWLASGLALLVMPLVWNAAPFLRLMGQDEAATQLAAAYLRAIAWGLLPSLWLVVLRGFLEGLADARPITLITLAGVGLNVLANYALIFGHFGFPALGLVGAGWASAAVYWLMVTLAAGYIVWRHFTYRVFAGFFWPEVSVLRELVTVGWPIAFTLAFETGLFSITALLMGLLGATELAAHQLALQSASLAFMVPLGASIAIAVRVGQAKGRGDVAAARLSGLVGMGLSVLFMSVTALTFWLVPEKIVGLYIDTSDPANALVVRTAASFLAFAALFQIFDGLQVSALGALRGLKDTRRPMLIALFSYWLVGLGAGLGLAFGLSYGGQGLWLGLVFGLATAALLLSRRFVQTLKATEAGALSTFF